MPYVLDRISILNTGYKAIRCVHHFHEHDIGIFTSFESAKEASEETDKIRKNVLDGSSFFCYCICFVSVACCFAFIYLLFFIFQQMEIGPNMKYRHTTHSQKRKDKIDEG